MRGRIAITANQVVNVFEHRLQYTTDTLPGSSGSPVFNDAWEVIALHHAGGNMISNTTRSIVIAGMKIWRKLPKFKTEITRNAKSPRTIRAIKIEIITQLFESIIRKRKKGL